MFKNKTLFKHFTVLSFMAFLFTGITLILFISNHVEKNMLQNLGGMEAAQIQMHIRELNEIIATTMFLGLLILYLLLMKVISNASRTLVYQNKKLQEQKQALESNYKNTIITLSNAVDARDPNTAGHSERVAKISLDIGIKLNLSESQLKNLELASLFHDIGKIGIPDKILLKPEKLTDDEFEIIKRHPVIGVNILTNINYLEPTLMLILFHHEKYSGNGYPTGIREREIPLGARIIAIADSYDAMISDRPYRKGMSPEAAVAEIINQRGIQFDPFIVDVFVEIFQCIKYS